MPESKSVSRLELGARAGRPCLRHDRFRLQSSDHPPSIVFELNVVDFARINRLGDFRVIFILITHREPPAT
jgi:hypothetical protein